MDERSSINISKQKLKWPLKNQFRKQKSCGEEACKESSGKKVVKKSSSSKKVVKKAAPAKKAVKKAAPAKKAHLQRR
ncbi:MAG: hypothetical protein IPJ26_04300 [Bacteroidetes bacterium]|nr:hypothetical protein [Bacteroidota bacterium]